MAVPQNALRYAYDEVNRLSKVLESRANGRTLATYIYDKNGNRTHLGYPATNLATEYAYNAANLVTDLTNKQGASVLSSFAYTYTYTDDGNQVGKTDNTEHTVSCEYDRLGRLTGEGDPERQTITYHYDRFQNRELMEVTIPPGAFGDSYATTYEYNLNNRLLKEQKTTGPRSETLFYRYDQNGSQVVWEREVEGR